VYHFKEWNRNAITINIQKFRKIMAKKNRLFVQEAVALATAKLPVSNI